MRIALISETWLPYVDGVVTRLRHTVAHLATAGHDVLVVAPTAGPPIERARQVVVPGTAIPFVDRRRRVGLPLSRRLRTVVLPFDPDLVHIVNPVLMGWAAFRGLAPRYPTVVSFHTDLESYTVRYGLAVLRPAVRTMMRQTYGRADLALATSPTGQQRLAALGVTAGLWPPAVDTHLFRQAERAAPPGWMSGDGERQTALYVGRLAPEKDLDI